MKNFVHDGKTLDVIAPSDGMKSGVPYQFGDLVGVSPVNADGGQPVSLWLVGVYSGMPKTTSEAWVVGQVLYFTAATQKFSTTGGAGTVLAGHADVAAGSNASVGTVRLER